MAETTLDFSKIQSWDDFHSECQFVLGFPEFYGRNMNAWIDCLTYMTNGGDGMSRFVLEQDEILTLRASGTQNISIAQVEILDVLKQCTAFVNKRYQQARDIPRIDLAIE